MKDKPTILLVDDDDFSANLTAQILSDDYNLQFAENGQEALAAVARSHFDLVLLDVEMLGLSGYEVCWNLRTNKAVSDLPVIFLSSHVDDEDRLTGYEAGGDDYLAKPVLPDELRAKVKRVLDNCAERRRLKNELSRTTTATTAMTNAADIGAVLQFLRNSINCQDYVTLSREVLNALRAFGYDSLVQIRGQQGVVSYGPDGACSPLEESVLSKMATQGRLFEFGTRTSFNCEHITIIVKNANQNDAEHQCSFIDCIAVLAEGADARVMAIDSNAAQAKTRGVLAAN